MNLNIFSPGRSVQSCIDRPDFRLAFLVVLLPALISAIGRVLLAFPVRLEEVVLSLAGSAGFWLLFSVVVFVVLYLIRGRELQGKFSSVASALSLLWVVYTILTLVAVLFVPLVFSADVLDEMRYLSTGQSTPEEFALAVGELLDANPNSVDENVLLVGVIVMVLLAFWMLYLLFSLVSDVSRHRAWLNVILTVVLLAVWVWMANWLFVLL